ncbi:ABC transporter transmembrane domain-containing protein [Rhodopseudomonas sp. P2A-2r]|uniref:ABC transporter transmembrane domain-containing protein n=1 Tax=Rhodopseudomonas sp. P2A-2r TaxID=2991972 RepID=UPI0029FF505E|nr:ABC transporter transmembrane domain-containing protein [Rhodopseudomonas sp. P2A-2r]
MMNQRQPIGHMVKNLQSVQNSTTADEGAFDLARRIGAAGFRATLAWQVARSLLRLLFAGSLAVFAGRLIQSGIFDSVVLAFTLASLGLTAIGGLFADLRAASAEAELVDGIRASLQDATARMSPARIRTKPAGDLIAGLQRHPPALASLVISHTAAKSLLGIGPLLVAATLAFVSWEATLMLLLAIPVMIVFFVMLGSMIRGKAEIQEKAFGRLAAQFSDRIRTLPTVLANHALQSEHGKIERRMTAYADSTMGVLKVAFLNAGIIDFFSALAIAVLAVLLGLGHLGLAHVPGFSGLALWQTLFVLIIAAEFFVPFRRYAELYHVKAEGQAAAKELDWFFDGRNAAQRSDTDTVWPFVPLCAGETTTLPPAGLVVVSGPSGSGKSTMLRMLAGIETPSSDIAAPLPIETSGCDWIATDIYVPAGTLAEVVAWNRGPVRRFALQEACENVGLIDENLLPGGLDARDRRRGRQSLRRSAHADRDCARAAFPWCGSSR